MLANFYRLQNEPKKVFGVYRIALRFDPQFVPSLMNLGKILIEQRKVAEGLRLLERASRLKPSDTVVASDLAVAYAMTGQTSKAEKIFLSLLQQDPKSPAARLNLGRIYFQTGRFDRATQALKQHLTVDPHSQEALQSLAWISACAPEAANRNTKLAQSCLARLEDLAESKDAELHDLRAAILADTGHFDSAVAEVRKAIQIATEQQNNRLVSQTRQRLQRYLDRQPYRLK